MALQSPLDPVDRDAQPQAHHDSEHNQTLQGSGQSVPESPSVKDYPLATASMPHYLRQFTYMDHGRLRRFDDELVSQLAPVEAQKRRLERLQLLGARARLDSFHKRRSDGGSLPAAKRQTNSHHVAGAPGLFGDTVSGPPVVATSGNDQWGVVDNGVESIASPTRPRDGSGGTADEIGESLLSPTASPTASPGPANDQYLSPHDDATAEPSVTTNGAVAASLVTISSTNAAAETEAPITPSDGEKKSLAHMARSIGAITDAFESLPSAVQGYQLFSLFRSCSRNTLSAMFAELEKALRCDVLKLLPPELSGKVLGYLDAPALCAASQTSRSWYRLVDGNENLWKSLLDKDGLTPTPEDLQRAEFERWGYTGWTKPGVSSWQPQHNALGGPVNMYKAIYRRRTLIARNWMDPNVEPNQYSILCPDREVITCLDLAEDKILASTDGKKHINVYDTATGRIERSFTDHEGGVWALKRVNHDTLVSGSVDHTVRVWSLSKGRCTHVLRGHTATVRCLDVVMPVQTVDNDTKRAVQLPQWPVIITGSRDATLRMWRLPGQNDAEFDNPKSGDSSEGDPYFIRSLTGHTNSVRAISGYGDMAVSGSYDHTVRVWRISTGECVHVLEGHQQNVYSAIIDPERNHCISASMDWRVNIWSMETGALLHSLDGHTALVGLLGLCSPRLVSAAADKTLRIWDPASGELLHKLVGHETAITCFHHDATRIVSGSEKHLKLWNARTGEFIRDLLTSMDHIWQVSFSHRRCVAAVSKGHSSFLEVLDFDVDPNDQVRTKITRVDDIRQLESITSAPAPEALEASPAPAPPAAPAASAEDSAMADTRPDRVLTNLVQSFVEPASQTTFRTRWMGNDSAGTAPASQSDSDPLFSFSAAPPS